LFIYVANWKMTVSYEQVKNLLSAHQADFETIQRPDTKVILCPSSPSLHLFSAIVERKLVSLGAQDCSPFPNGPHTGDVDALSLKQLGCSYCIVGHSERRITYKESPELVAQKVAQLQLNQIMPIVCIGETAEEKEHGATRAVLEAQLKPILTVSAGTQGPLLIAYEPVWAIGSGKQPTMDELAQTVAAIKKQSAVIYNKPIPVLYGGSVTAENIGIIKKVTGIEGVLIGSASTDFNSLQKIVS
jgi:triosephosphate isomerase